MRQLLCTCVWLAAVLMAGMAEAQQEGRPVRIGLVSLHSEELAVHVDDIRQELQKLGYTEGRAKIDAHFTNGDKQRAREILRSFVESRMDVIVPWTTPRYNSRGKPPRPFPS